jgi:hypothetical protein
MPSATAASRSESISALDDVWTVWPLALRIAFPVQNFRRGADSRRSSTPAS